MDEFDNVQVLLTAVYGPFLVVPLLLVFSMAQGEPFAAKSKHGKKE
jgi:hypothetical protein